MNLFSFASIALFFLVITAFCTLYIMAALSRFSAQILEFKRFRDIATQDDSNSLAALRDSVQSSSEKIFAMAAQSEQLVEFFTQSALQLKAIREDHFTLSSNLDVRFTTFSKQINELVEHFNAFQEGLSQFSHGLQEDSAKVQLAIRQVQESLQLVNSSGD